MASQSRRCDHRARVSFYRSQELVEMVWHLYKWDNDVEVIEAALLRQLFAGWQNNRLGVLP